MEAVSLPPDVALLGTAAARADVAPAIATAQQSVRRPHVAAAKVRSREAPRALLYAPILVLALGGVAFAAALGSPLHGWIADKVAPVALLATVERKIAPVSAPARVPPAFGVSILPAGGSVRVELNGAGPGLLVRARGGDGEQMEVSGTGAAAGARFRIRPGRVEVVDVGVGEVAVVLPRGAAAAVIEVNGHVYVAKEGDRLRLSRPGTDATLVREAEFA